MTRFAHPVRAEVLFDTPEMGLRSIGEVEVDRSGADEGEGTGFDNLDPSAYAERIFTASFPMADVLLWYGEQLGALGWEETHVDDEVRMFRRLDDESLQVQKLPSQDTWTRQYGRGGPFGRIRIHVRSSWKGS